MLMDLAVHEQSYIYIQYYTSSDYMDWEKMFALVEISVTVEFCLGEQCFYLYHTDATTCFILFVCG